MQESHSLIRPQSKEQGRADEVQNGMSSSSSKDVSEGNALETPMAGDVQPPPSALDGPEETRRPQIAR